MTNAITCFRCKRSGGTLIKVGNRGYAHMSCYTEGYVVTIKDGKLVRRKK